MHIVNGVLRTEVSKEIIYTEEYCVHWNSWLIRLCATASRSMGGKQCLFVITLHICRISDCGLEGLISHGEFLNLCCVVMRLLSQPTKPQRRQQFVCSDQSKWSRRGPEGLPVRPEEGVCCWWGSGSGRRRGLCARQMVRQVWRRVCRQTPESLCVWIEASFTLLWARCFRGKWVSVFTHSLKIRIFNILRTCDDFYNLSHSLALYSRTFFMNNTVVCSQAGSCSCARILHMHFPLRACHCKID